MTAGATRLTFEGTGLPVVTLLDAREAGLDLPGLQVWARTLTSESGEPFLVRSYRFPYAMVAWHDAPVGIDIERYETYPDGFAATICTPDELRLAATSDLTALWCGKEALAKALGDALNYDPRLLQSPVSWPSGVAGRWRAKALTAPPNHVAWLCWSKGSAPGVAVAV